MSTEIAEGRLNGESEFQIGNFKFQKGITGKTQRRRAAQNTEAAVARIKSCERKTTG